MSECGGMKIIFLGTPDFAVPSLRMLVENGYHVAACITQPDRKAGRGHKFAPPPVKVFAQENGIPVYQFEKVSGEEGAAFLEQENPDLLITAAFGHILSERVLAIPKHGCINVHASLLPKLRGAAPIQWAIINGETRTGVTTMLTVKALDAGDILEQDAVDIPDDMTAGQLYRVLSELGAKTLLRTLQKLEAGTLAATPQNEADATYFPLFKKGFGEIDFSKPCAEIINLVRGTNPVPGAYVRYQNEKIRVLRAAKTNVQKDASENINIPNNLLPGAILAADEKSGLLVRAADGVLSLEEIKREGAKAMAAKDSLRGKKLEIGYLFRKPERETQ